MPFVSAHDLQTGAAFVLPGNARCVPATPSHRIHEIDQAIDHQHVDPGEMMPIASFPPGTVVYAEWQASRWIKLRVLPPR